MSPPSQGASAEFIALLTGNQRKLYAFILSLVRRPADADDILQETNLVLWQKHADFDPDTNFDAWSFRVAHFQVLAHRKKQKRSKLHFDAELVELLASEAALEIEASHDRRHTALSGCLQKLSKEHRTIIARRYQPGASVNDMAAEQGKSPKALSEVLRRIRKNLMSCIELSLIREA